MHLPWAAPPGTSTHTPAPVPRNPTSAQLGAFSPKRCCGSCSAPTPAIAMSVPAYGPCGFRPCRFRSSEKMGFSFQLRMAVRARIVKLAVFLCGFQINKHQKILTLPVCLLSVVFQQFFFHWHKALLLVFIKHDVNGVLRWLRPQVASLWTSSSFYLLSRS